MTLSADRFGEYFRAVHDGRDPFGWQRRLLADVTGTGQWPAEISAPTGAGKTAVIDVHVFAVALMAAGAGVRIPRRLTMVVDRRVLVDDQYEHALGLRDLLSDTRTGILAEVTRELRGLAGWSEDPDSATGAPLLVSRLRGGMPPPRRWREDPAACQVICCTPDMWGSRLLMGGYGATALARPREAGLLAYDCVAVVDEAHLSRQLICTAERVAHLASAADHQLPVPVLQVVRTSATPDRESQGHTVVSVTPEDLDEDARLRVRLTAEKPVELLELPQWPLPVRGTARNTTIAALATRVRGLRENFGPTVGCFVNNVSTAIDLARALEPNGTVQLICGRLRPYDVQEIRKNHPGLLTIDGDEMVDYLVSTQSMEAGADLDLSAALTEAAPASAIAQRAGRVNRLGKRPGTRIVVTVPSKNLEDNAKPWPYTAEDINASLTWLRERASTPSGLAPWSLCAHPPPAQAVRRTLLQRPELSDAWAWARTSDSPAAPSDLDLWLSDDLDEDLDVGLVVRQGLPDDMATELIQATMPQEHEVFPVRISLARKRVTGNAVIVRGDQASDYTEEDLRPGDIIVTGDDTAIFDGRPAVVSGEGTEQASDVLELPGPSQGQFVLRLGTGPSVREHGLHPGDIAGVLALAASLLDERSAKGLRSRNDQIAQALEELDVPGNPRVAHAISLLRGPVKNCSITLPDVPAGELPSWLVIADTRRRVLDEEARQQWTRSQSQVTLVQHSQAVADRAGHIATQLGMAEFTELLRRAGLHHDDGKRDDRFQLSLDPERASSEPLAKSGMTRLADIRKARAASGLPPEWRHEQLSVLLCWPHLADLPAAQQQLVARLVGTSHGQGRSGFPHTGTELTGDPELAGLASQLFDVGEWDHLIESTQRAFGIWGCAYLEALLRAADGQVSAEGS
ncbi:MAG TPA: hypothetical protein VN969_02320 [Streptosporangiaceae bacterium]|nr:hypothetical protein [Streptosporangiaceae bacterium]